MRRRHDGVERAEGQVPSKVRPALTGVAARGFRTRRLLHESPGERVGGLLWCAGIVGAGSFAFANVILHAFVYGSKAWVSTPATVACLLMTVVSMGAAILGSIVRSAGGGR